MRNRLLVLMIAALLIVSFAGCRTAPRNDDGTKMTKAERREAAREAKEQAREEKAAKAEARREAKEKARTEKHAAATTPPPAPAPAPVASAPAGAVAKTNRIALHFDRGVDPAKMSPQQVRAQNQLADWMERDLRSMITKSGFVIDDKSQTALNIRITDYNPGSTAARVWVGYGAGAASLNIHYEIVQSGRAVKRDDIGVGSSQSWQKCARKLNTDTVDAMRALLK